MKQRRFLWHILFWLVQYGVCLYNELYISASFSTDPSVAMFLQSALSIGLTLLIKIAVVYTVLYYLIPKWIKTPVRLIIYIEAAFLILLATLLMRLLIHFIVWPLIYDNPQTGLSAMRLIARYFYSLLDMLQVVGLASAIKLFKLRINAVKNEKLLVQEKLRSEILHLKSQVNPHFLFNTLNSIYSLSRAQSAAAPDAIMRLSKILRYMLYETSEKTTPLSEELKIMNDYIELQQLRFGKRLTVELEKTVDDGSAQLAPLLLLPLVENAFKHGSNDGGTIAIQLVLKNSQLRFTISNPLAEAVFKAKGDEGIGLANIRRQLELLYRSFSLQTTRKENTFSVTLAIDLLTYAGIELFDSRR